MTYITILLIYHGSTILISADTSHQYRPKLSACRYIYQGQIQHNMFHALKIDEWNSVPNSLKIVHHVPEFSCNTELYQCILHCANYDTVIYRLKAIHKWPRIKSQMN